MRTYFEKLQSLNNDSVWLVTKQEANFDNSFNAVRLFADITDRANTNIEEYFGLHHEEYNVPTDRHRILVISQLYGLLTKTPFNGKGQYVDEYPTDVFNKNRNQKVGSREYNTFKTEQIMKFKIRSIVDNANNNQGYNILPVIFIYMALREIRQKYNAKWVSENFLYTYIMTAQSYDELDEIVHFYYSDAKKDSHTLLPTYKDRSRVLTMIRENLNLFLFKDGKVSINPIFDDYFYKNFIKKYNIKEMHNLIQNDANYAYFLYEDIGFNINLIDPPEEKEIARGDEHNDLIPDDEKISLPGFIDESGDETEYIEKVDIVDEKHINPKVSIGAYNEQPLPVKQTATGRKYKINPLFGKIAIMESDYRCVFDESHETFPSKATSKPYMEAHHLIPVSFQEEIWNRYHVNIDCVENIVCLCPTCHRAIHYGNNETKAKMLEKLYDLCKEKYKTIGLNITLDELKKMYKL